MRHFLRFNNFIFLLAFSIFTITACQKKADPVPEDTTGSFDGTITPAGSISYITPTYQGSTGSTSGGGPDPTGYFKVNGLTAGNYVLVFTPAAGYTAPAPQVVTITAKGTTSLGTIKVNATPPVNTAVSYPLQGTVNWTSTSNSLTSTGGTYANAPASGSLTLYNGVPTGITIKATGQSGAITETVELYLPRYTSPALYQLDYSAGTNYATYLRTSGGVVTDAYNTKVLAPVGTVTVTEHNLTARTIRGTFGYAGYDTKGALKVTVSTGSFSLSY